MRWACFAGKMGMLLVAIGSLTLPPVAPGQDADQDKARPATKVAGSAGAEETVQAIDDEYDRQLLHLEQRRIEQLGRLAARQQPALAAATYERLFRLAIAGDLFREAEAAAVKVVEQGTPSPTTDALAHLVKIIAEVERGAFEQSLQSLRRAIAESTQEKQATEARAALAPAEVIGICEAYYQRLVEGNQFAIAREAFRLVLEQPYSPAVKDFLASRLKRIELVASRLLPSRERISMARCSTSRRKKGKSSWSSSGQAGTCPVPPRSHGSSRSGMPITNAACASWVSTSMPPRKAARSWKQSCPISAGSCSTTISPGPPW